MFLTYQNTAEATIVQKQVLRGSFLNRDATLWLATYGGSLPMEAHEKLLLNNKNHQKIIRQLNDLEGAVHIDSMTAALQYVRLRTSPSTWFTWNSSPIVEVISTKQAAELPNYGLRKHTSSTAKSGFIGIISNEDFSRGNFSLARVSANKNGFTVIRWLLATNQRKYEVKLIKEEVGFTGTYKFSILQVKAAPSLSATRWQIPTFE